MPPVSYTQSVRGIMPMVHRSPPEFTVAIGVICLGFAYFYEAWPIGVLGAVCTLIGVHELWQSRRKPK